MKKNDQILAIERQLRVYANWEKSNEKHAKKRIKDIDSATYEMYLAGVFTKDEYEYINDIVIELLVEYETRF